MKNALLKSFLALFVLVNAIFFSDIVSVFYVVSDALWAVANFDVMCVVLGCLYGILFVVFLIYFFKRKEKYDFVTTVEFKSPNDMTPTEVGFLVDGVVDSSDISALFVYWASKKYVEISNDKKNQKMKKLVDSLPEDAKPYEKLLFSKIFVKNKEILIDKIASKLNDNMTVPAIVKEVESSIGSKYFDSKNIWLRQLFICLFAMLFYVSVMYFRLEYFADVIPIVEIFAIVSTALFVMAADWLLNYFDYRHKNNSSKGRIFSFVGFLVLMSGIGALCAYFFWTDLYQVFFLFGALIFMLFAVLLSRNIRIYTKEGLKKLGQILGFKVFIQVAESDRIKILVEENPNVFYDVLPYAFVLGVSDKWIKQMDVVRVDNPQVVTEDMVSTVLIYSLLFSNHNMNFINLMRISRAASIATSAISLGANGGSGKTKGGSNFGGFRRR